MLKNLNAGHALGFVLVAAAQIIQFLQTKPELAQEMHLTQAGLTLAGALVLALSKEMIGSGAPEAPKS